MWSKWQRYKARYCSSAIRSRMKQLVTLSFVSPTLDSREDFHFLRINGESCTVLHLKIDPRDWSQMTMIQNNSWGWCFLSRVHMMLFKGWFWISNRLPSGKQPSLHDMQQKIFFLMHNDEWSTKLLKLGDVVIEHVATMAVIHNLWRVLFIAELDERQSVTIALTRSEAFDTIPPRGLFLKTKVFCICMSSGLPSTCFESLIKKKGHLKKILPRWIFLSLSMSVWKIQNLT